MNVPRIATLLTLIVIAIPVDLRAQEEALIGPGDRLRVTAPGLGGAGAIVGTFIKTDRWEDIPLDDLRIELSPVAADGVSVSASLRFRGGKRAGFRGGDE